MEEFKMLAKTFKGLEDVLAEELTAIGANNIQKERRAVSFTGDKQVLYKANLWLRTASRVLVPILEFAAKDADEVYEKAKTIVWEKYMDTHTTFTIDSTVYSEVFRHSKYVTYRVKDAIADYFMEKEGKRPNVNVSNPDFYINVHIAEDTVTISLDSSGESLHKRGWREAQTEAPINEALAAGMLLMAGWKGETDFVDPMCGSGTFLIEAAMIALNIPPGIYRDGFAFEHWKDFDHDLFEDIYNDDSSEREFAHTIYGSDASFYAVRVAEKNVRRAGLQKHIQLKQIRLQELQARETPCFLMSNPPYGERLGEDKDIYELYKEIGSMLKHKFAGSTAWLISSNTDALKHIGLRPSQRIALLNSELECQFVEYELFEGERREWAQTDEGRRSCEERTQREEDKRQAKSRDNQHRGRRDFGKKSFGGKSFGRKADDGQAEGKREDKHFERKPFERRHSDAPFERKGSPKRGKHKPFEQKREDRPFERKSFAHKEIGKERPIRREKNNEEIHRDSSRGERKAYGERRSQAVHAPRRSSRPRKDD